MLRLSCNHSTIDNSQEKRERNHSKIKSIYVITTNSALALFRLPHLPYILTRAAPTTTLNSPPIPGIEAWISQILYRGPTLAHESSSQTFPRHGALMKYAKSVESTSATKFGRRPTYGTHDQVTAIWSSSHGGIIWTWLMLSPTITLHGDRHFDISIHSDSIISHCWCPIGQSVVHLWEHTTELFVSYHTSNYLAYVAFCLLDFTILVGLVACWFLLTMIIKLSSTM